MAKILSRDNADTRLSNDSTFVYYWFDAGLALVDDTNDPAETHILVDTEEGLVEDMEGRLEEDYTLVEVRKPRPPGWGV